MKFSAIRVFTALFWSTIFEVIKMGSGSSKTRRCSGSEVSSVSSTSSFSSSVSSSVGRRKSKTRGVFSSSCLGSSSRTYDTDDDDDQVTNSSVVFNRYFFRSFRVIWFRVFNLMALLFLFWRDMIWKLLMCMLLCVYFNCLAAYSSLWHFGILGLLCCHVAENGENLGLIMMGDFLVLFGFACQYWKKL